MQAQPLFPAGTEWVADYDPITSLGSTAWADVSINVSVLPTAPAPRESLLDTLIIHPDTHTGLFDAHNSFPSSLNLNLNPNTSRITSRITSGSGGSTASGPIASGAYAGVCVRQWDLYDTGYCLLVGAGLTGAGVGSGKGWVLQAGSGHLARVAGTILASGGLPASFDLGAWHTVVLQAKGTSLVALVDDTQVASVTATTFSAGLVSLRSGYHYAKFDNLHIDGINPEENSLLVGVVPRGCDRNDFTGLVGFAVTLSADMTLTRLGRFFGSSNPSVRVVSVVDALSSATLGHTVLSSSTPRDVYGFAYADVVGGGVAVKAGQRVYIVANETKGEDLFCDLSSYGTAVQGVCSGVVPVFYMDGKWTEYDQLVNSLYGPLNAVFQL